jgi:hypothetical protein
LSGEVFCCIVDDPKNDLKNKESRSLARGGFCLGGRRNQSGLLPAAILTDGHTLSLLRKLDEPRSVAACYNALAGATGKAVQIAPIIK